MGGRWGEVQWEDNGGGSDLLDGLGWNQASLLAAAQFQKHLTIFYLSHADLRRAEASERLSQHNSATGP